MPRLAALDSDFEDQVLEQAFTSPAHSLRLVWGRAALAAAAALVIGLGGFWAFQGLGHEGEAGSAAGVADSSGATEGGTDAGSPGVTSTLIAGTRVLVVQDPGLGFHTAIDTFDHVGMEHGDLIADWGR